MLKKNDKLGVVNMSKEKEVDFWDRSWQTKPREEWTEFDKRCHDVQRICGNDNWMDEPLHLDNSNDDYHFRGAW